MDMNTRSFASEFLSEDWTTTENFVGRAMFVTSATSIAMNTSVHRNSFGYVFPRGTWATGESGDENGSNGHSVFLGEILHPRTWHLQTYISIGRQAQRTVIVPW